MAAAPPPPTGSPWPFGGSEEDRRLTRPDRASPTRVYSVSKGPSLWLQRVPTVPIRRREISVRRSAALFAEPPARSFTHLWRALLGVATDQHRRLIAEQRVRGRNHRGGSCGPCSRRTPCCATVAIAMWTLSRAGPKAQSRDTAWLSFAGPPGDWTRNSLGLKPRRLACACAPTSGWPAEKDSI